jgi:hypothetical protein
MVHHGKRNATDTPTSTRSDTKTTRLDPLSSFDAQLALFQGALLTSQEAFSKHKENASPSLILPPLFSMMQGMLELMKTQQQMNTLLVDRLKALTDDRQNFSAPLLMDQSETPQLFVPKQITSADEEIRLRSLVIQGLPESKDHSSVQRAKDDFASVERILDSIQAEAVPLSVFRMGRPDQVNPRLLKVVLPSSTLQRFVLSKSRLLKDSNDFSDLQIRPSLTREQRQAEFELRKEKRRQMEEDPSLDLIVFNGAIIKRIDRPSRDRPIPRLPNSRRAGNFQPQ